MYTGCTMLCTRVRPHLGARYANGLATWTLYMAHGYGLDGGVAFFVLIKYLEVLNLKGSRI
eukprot:SAG31_NODE_2650_length_5298_cov_1.690710_7_plen_61_part_00